MRKIALGLLIATSLQPAHGATALEKNTARMAAMSAGDFRNAVAIQDDSMETVAVITTKSAYKSKGEADTWMMAGIDKQTGRTVYQLVGFTHYIGGWRFYSRGTYARPSGPVSGQLRTQRRVDNCYVSCQFEETVSIDIPETTLREIAADPRMWRMRFQGQGAVWDDAMNPAEVAALLETVDSYRRSRF